MKPAYEVYVRHEVYQALAAVPEEARDRILTFIETLADNPFREGDLTVRDHSGRLHQVKTLGRLALYYFPDHSEKEVRVVDLVDADA